MPLTFVDTRQHIQITPGSHLPHWAQGHSTQFITFRLADSLPQDKLLEIKQSRQQWLNDHPKPWDTDTTMQYDSLTQTCDKWIDAGYGECILQYVEVRDIVVQTIMYGDKDEYDVMAFVIMPNHVHVILAVRDGHSLQDIVGKWKRVSSHRINKLLGREGSVWERDAFDRLLRSYKDYTNKVNYIIDNPKHLPLGTYTLYIK